MKWTEHQIAHAIARQIFRLRHLLLLPNCIWTGYECDLLAVTNDLRIIDVEVKISRADLKADYKKEKWWKRHPSTWNAATRTYEPAAPDERRQWPPKVWKHYYAMPADIWKPDLIEFLPPASGILLLRVQQGVQHLAAPAIVVHCERQAKPNREAEKLTPGEAIDVARLSSVRLWDAYEKLAIAAEAVHP